jgi:hypothetical protein
VNLEGLPNFGQFVPIFGHFVPKFGKHHEFFSCWRLSEKVFLSLNVAIFSANGSPAFHYENIAKMSHHFIVMW